MSFSCDAASDGLQPLSSVLIVGEVFFVCAKFRGVDKDAAPANVGLVFDVEHLVEHDIVDNEPRHSGGIKDSADKDAMACGVVAP